MSLKHHKHKTLLLTALTGFLRRVPDTHQDQKLKAASYYGYVQMLLPLNLEPQTLNLQQNPKLMA